MEREEQGTTSTNPGENENSTKSMELDPQLEADEENEAEEEDGDGDGDGDDDEEEEESNYKLRFEGGMDPLAFTEDDAFGVQPYQQFERLESEYEALAAKKRKSLANPQSFRKTPMKKLRQDDDPSKSFEEIMEAMTYGMRRKSRRKVATIHRSRTVDETYNVTPTLDSRMRDDKKKEFSKKAKLSPPIK